MLGDTTYHNLENDFVNPKHLVEMLCLILGVGFGTALIIMSIVGTYVNACYYTKVRQVILEEEGKDIP